MGWEIPESKYWVLMRFLAFQIEANSPSELAEWSQNITQSSKPEQQKEGKVKKPWSEEEGDAVS